MMPGEAPARGAVGDGAGAGASVIAMSSRQGRRLRNSWSMARRARGSAATLAHQAGIVMQRQHHAIDAENQVVDIGVAAQVALADRLPDRAAELAAASP